MTNERTVQLLNLFWEGGDVECPEEETIDLIARGLLRLPIFGGAMVTPAGQRFRLLGEADGTLHKKAFLNGDGHHGLAASLIEMKTVTGSILGRWTLTDCTNKIVIDLSIDGPAARLNAEAKLQQIIAHAEELLECISTSSGLLNEERKKKLRSQ